MQRDIAPAGANVLHLPRQLRAGRQAKSHPVHTLPPLGVSGRVAQDQGLLPAVQGSAAVAWLNSIKHPVCTGPWYPATHSMMATVCTMCPEGGRVCSGPALAQSVTLDRRHTVDSAILVHGHVGHKNSCANALLGHACIAVTSMLHKTSPSSSACNNHKL